MCNFLAGFVFAGRPKLFACLNFWIKRHGSNLCLVLGRTSGTCWKDNYMLGTVIPLQLMTVLLGLHCNTYGLKRYTSAEGILALCLARMFYLHAAICAPTLLITFKA